jgi:SAM-dependent methyltransferase
MSTRRAGRGDTDRDNRTRWDAHSDGYQEAHSGQLARAGMAWGVWSIPEADVGALGAVAGRRTLEIGCGAAHWSAALAQRGAECVGLDLSGRQLAAARRATAGTRVALVQASAARLPFADASFDLVFCDHGGVSWADPGLVVPEAARVLRPGGRFVANVASPWMHACYDERADATDTRLHEPYFDRRQIPLGDGGAVYNPTYGEWIRIFRDSGLVIEDLVELRPPPGATTTYTWYVSAEWADRWPAEMLWVATRRAD